MTIYDAYEWGFSEKKSELLEKELRALFDDDEFVLGTFNDLETDDDVDFVLNFIKENKGNFSREDLYVEVVLLTLEMHTDED